MNIVEPKPQQIAVKRTWWTNGRMRNRIIILMVAVLSPILMISTIYSVQEQRKELEDLLLERAESTAIAGATIVGNMLEEAIKNGVLTQEQVFDHSYINFWEFNPAKDPAFDPDANPDPSSFDKYHTSYDEYTDKNWQVIIDSFLVDEDVLYAVPVDINGYLPTHNTRYSSGDGSAATDRTKRIFNDPVGILAAHNIKTTLQQVYPRPGTGEILWDISAPIYVNGEHWGGFRVGVQLGANQARVIATTWRSAIASFIVIAALVAFAWFLGQYISVPIESLTTAATQAASGDLNVGIELPNRDEISLLGQAFTDMVAQLRSLIGSLEQRVAERTSALEGSALLIEHRASQLETIAEVASSVASLQDVNHLLPYITKTVSERFGFYHTGIFLLSENKEYAVMRAASSDGGQKMLARKHQLRIGQEGIVGFAIDQKRARIALDVGEDAVFFNNPELPATRSEIALPLIVGEEVIGALDVQSEEPNAFSNEDIRVLTTLANQVAVAIKNARLYEQSQEAMRELENTFQRYISSEWRQFANQSQFIGYRARQTGLEPITDTMQESDTNNGVKVPLVLRGVTLGSLEIKMDEAPEGISQEELGLVQAIADRLALAMESARLLEDSQRLAAKEQMVGDITTKISASINMKNVLQTAVEELGRAIPGSEVIIQLSQQDGQ